MSSVADIIDRLQDILEKEREERVLIKDVAEALNMSPAQLSNYKKRNSNPYDKISEYCATNRINLNWVLYGQPVEMLNSDVENIYKIKLIDGVHSSAGGGAFNEESEDVTYLSIDPLFADMLNIKNSDHIEAIRVAGDSMEDTLGEGSIIMIDRSRTELTSGGIFVLNTQGGVIVKRISINPNGTTIDLISDNKIYPVQSVPADEITVIGRVIGALEKI